MHLTVMKPKQTESLVWMLKLLRNLTKTRSLSRNLVSLKLCVHRQIVKNTVVKINELLIAVHFYVFLFPQVLFVFITAEHNVSYMFEVHRFHKLAIVPTFDTEGTVSLNGNG